MKKSFTRLEIQGILEQNSLNADVSYLEREGADSPDNFILYFREKPNSSFFADNSIHIRNIGLQIVHLHKKKLDSIEDLMRENFSVEPSSYQIKQLGTDYFGTYYNFDILTTGGW